MAITIIGNNIQQYGDRGFYESDPSTWFFGSDSIREITRSTEFKTEGNHSLKCAILTNVTNTDALFLVRGQVFQAFSGKTYIAKAKIRSSSAPKIASDNSELYISTPGNANINVISQVRRTVLDLTGNGNPFLEIETRFSVNIDANAYKLNINVDQGNNLNLGGFIHVDEFTVFEYEDVAEPDCNIQIDVSGSNVVNASGPGQTDGSITVVTTGTPESALEYSKDGGTTWQSSNQFTGLGYGIYQVVIRESARISCSDTQDFAINEGASDFDFNLSTEDTSTLGASDGSIEITLTGNPATPVEYSIDGGSSFQLGNVFDNLQANTYLVVVRDANNVLVSKTAIVGNANSFFNEIFFSENLIPYQRAQTANSSEENYKMFLKILTSAVTAGFTNLNFTEKMRQALKPNAAGKATFNLRPAFRNLFKAVPPAKNSAFSLILDRSILSKKQFGDIFNELAEPSFLTDGLVDLVVYGGINKEKYPNVSYFKAYLPQEKKFLSWRPRISYIDQSQEDYLTYMVVSNLTSQIKIRVKAYYDDGTTETATINSSSTAQPIYGNIYQIPAGPQISGAQGINPAKNMTEYDIWLDNQNNEVITEVMNFKLTRFRSSYTRYILFLNSVGGYDVVRLTGKTSKATEVEKQKVMKYLDFDYLASEGEEKTTDTKSIQKIQYSSGMFKGKYAEYMAEYMQDLLHSKKVYDITNGERIPINIDGGTFQIKESGDFKYFTRFEASLSYTENQFSPSVLPKLGE